MRTYSQYCPISRAAELLGDRWTLHIVRDLLTGATRFNDLIKGNPGLSRALLSRRLRQLQMAGIVAQGDDGGYLLTESGRDLKPLIFGLATWGAKWTFGEPTADELDPDLLVWWLHRQLDTSGLPRPRFTVYLPFTDHASRYWIVAEDVASVCLSDPGFEVDLAIHTDRSALYETYLGRRSLLDAQRVGAIELEGSRSAIRAFNQAFHQSPVASIVGAEAR